MASSKMQRWALTLLAYKYEPLYRPGNENGNADGLSRLPVLDVPGSTPVPGDIVHLLETRPLLVPHYTLGNGRAALGRECT